MGMFDYVEYEAKCHYCDNILIDWQSKSSHCVLDVLKPYEVKNFYTNCSNCKQWNEYIVEADIEETIKVNKLEIKFIDRRNQGTKIK
tara:strand:- start:1400 stop:1660 length:261 start_codon:yes stop_codon:yes gene_type:complete